MMKTWTATLVLLAGCYSSFGFGGDVPDDAADADAADGPADDSGGADADADADAESDVTPDGAVTCPPIMDGTWFSMELTTSREELDLDLETPCRLNMVVGGPAGHEVVELTCGTGARMDTYTIDFFANPPVYVAFWEDQDVTLHWVSQETWWINRWFTVRGRSGDLLFAGSSAHTLLPPGETAESWFAPVGVRVADGFCPAAEDVCGLAERQAIEVTYGGSAGLIFDGYHGSVGELITADVHVGTATIHRTMECEDAPGSWYTLALVLLPEG